MKYLDKLIEYAVNNNERFGGNLFIHINDHEASYQSIKDYLAQFKEIDVPNEDKKNMEKSKTIVKLEFFLRKPVSLYISLKATTEEAAKEIWESLQES